jgi:hypothetical protein
MLKRKINKPEDFTSGSSINFLHDVFKLIQCLEVILSNKFLPSKLILTYIKNLNLLI